jgi:nucleotidyltransferase/DNA polymerase involved in DNA repair
MIKPIGLTIPECHCFQERLTVMNDNIDNLSAMICTAVVISAQRMHICDQAKDYFISALMADMMMTLLPKQKSREETMQECANEYEEIYERIKPLIMQRLEYADGVVDSMEKR